MAAPAPQRSQDRAQRRYGVSRVLHKGASGSSLQQPAEPGHANAASGVGTRRAQYRRGPHQRSASTAGPGAGLTGDDSPHAGTIPSGYDTGMAFCGMRHEAFMTSAARAVLSFAFGGEGMSRTLLNLS